MVLSLSVSSLKNIKSATKYIIMTQNYPLGEVASQVRRDIVRMVNLAASGHPGGSLSSTDILTVLFFAEMNHDPANWRRDGKGRDMFFLSAGHLSPVFYSILARSGYFSVSELATFRKMGSRLQGHPSVERGLPGVHVASGSLGQGLSVACGAAIAKKLEGEKSVVFALLGDGEQQEGQIWEAAMFASHQKLGNLIAITDWNGQQIDGPNDKVISLGDLKAKWNAFGWDVVVADGHDLEAIKAVLKSARESVSDERPKMLLMKTDMGKGVDFMQGTHQWHGKAPNADQTEKALSQLKETIGDF